MKALAWLAAALAAAQPIARLEVVSGGYPRAFFFRGAEGSAAQPSITYQRWEATFSRLMGIEGKALDEEVPGRSLRNIEFFTRFKQRHPEQLVLLHYNGNARDPVNDTGRYFAGHWLYYNGARLLADVPAHPGETVIRVSDARLFVTGMGRFRNANEDVGLCELDAAGRPDWSRSEQVKLIAVDRRAGTITVRRAQYGTAPRAFHAGKAWAAAHVTEGPWGKGSHLLWDYNHSTACPRDAAGRACNDVLVEELAALFRHGGRLAAFDGVQFDVLKHSLAANRGPRGVDTDGDGRADAGIINGVNAYGVGSVGFCARLRAVMGEGKLILSDGWSPNNQRAFGVLNGIESEGWPALQDYRIADWSGGLNRQGFWAARSRPPAFNYVNHKFNIKGEIIDWSSPQIGWNTHRLVFAGAVFADSAVCYSLRPPKSDSELLGIWDELWKGTEHQLGWLGQPVSAAVHLAERQRNLLAGQPAPAPAASGAATRFVIPAPPGASELLFAFTAKAEPSRAAGSARMMRVNGSHAWVDGKGFRYACYFPEAPKQIEISVEGTEPVAITNLAAYAHADAMYRVFERGIVLANPSPHPYRFDLAAIAPGKRYRRLRGSPDQDVKTNDGSPVAAVVELGPKDALFLAAQ